METPNDKGQKAVVKEKGRGFTLLEIMIALAIIGTALTVIIHTVNYHANIMYENTLTTRLYQIAKEKMSQLEESPRSTMGAITTDGVEYENTVLPLEDSRFAILKTVVRSQGKEVVLNGLVVIKQDPWQQ